VRITDSAGVHDFDTLLESARYLGVENLSGFEFWGLERDGGIASLRELILAPQEQVAGGTR
jgi:hypothetical protein